MDNDIYAIVGRMKNSLSRKDLNLTPAGTIFINSYALVLKELHEFARELPDPYGDQLRRILIAKESLPLYVIGLTTPEPEDEEGLT